MSSHSDDNNAFLEDLVALSVYFWIRNDVLVPLGIFFFNKTNNQIAYYWNCVCPLSPYYVDLVLFLHNFELVQNEILKSRALFYFRRNCAKFTILFEYDNIVNKYQDFAVSKLIYHILLSMHYYNK